MWVWALDPNKQHPCFDLSALRGCSFGEPSLKFFKYPPMSELARNTMWALPPSPPAWSCVGPGCPKHLLQYFLFASDWDLYTVLAALSAWMRLPEPRPELTWAWSLFVPFGILSNLLYPSQPYEKGWSDAPRNFEVPRSGSRKAVWQVNIFCRPTQYFSFRITWTWLP